MTDKYSSDLCRIVIAQITQTIGYSCTLSAPLELLQDIMQKFMHEFARDLHGHMEHANRLEPSVKDARHSLKNLNINVQELLDYIGNVEPVGFTRDVPKFPIKRASNMNFLKPGSAETLTRPIHIFEYLPPMQETESSETTRGSEKPESSQNQDDIGANAEINDKLGSFNHMESQSPNRSKLHFPSSSNINNFDSDLNRSSLWELSSVVMTTGGFISPAIEGKLPEAFIPDIIEEYKGLDAPPLTSLILQPLSCSPKLETKKTHQQEPENDNCKQISTSISIANASADSSLLLLRPNNNSTTPKVSSKKNKKQKDNLNRDKNDIKTQEKAQRRAMKLYQKLTKNQNEDGQMLNLKKPKKVSSSDSNKVQQLQKLMKKQAKQRQRQLKGLTIEDKGLSFVETPKHINTNVNPITENQVTVERSVEVISAVSSGTDQNSDFMLAESKKACEPERNKLDVFKKITKQRVVLPTNNAFGNPTISGNPPIISLPSGTTITPTLTPTPLPLIGVNSEPTMSNFNILAQRTSPEISSVDILTKPKKRGRKPGGKNQIKQPNLTASQSLITFPIPNLISSANLTTDQPLNLSNSTDQTMNLISKNVQFKEKKERKKGKLKYEASNLTADNNNKEVNIRAMYSSPEKITSSTKTNVVQDQFITPPNSTATIHSSSLYSAQQGGGMVPMPLLPLLHFPPQPGLIPTGPPPGLFPGVVTGLVGFGAGTNANQVGVPPFFAFSGPRDSSVAVKDDDDSDQLKLFRRTSSQTDLQTENRNYCNVAPLIPPDSMKLTECAEVTFSGTNLDNPYAQTPQKGKATGNLGDPIEVSDDSDEALENSRKPLLMPKPEIQAPESFEDKSHLDLRNILPLPPPPSSGDRDKVKKFKSPVKLSLINSAPPSSSSTSSISSTSPFPSRFQLPNFIGGGDKFSLAGGADLIPLSRVDCGSAYSSQKVPSNSLTAQQNINDDHQSFMPKFPTYEDITITPTGVTVPSTDLKQRKHHKKLKKIKDGKIKKKKDKKEKSKEKDLVIGGGITTTSYKSDKKMKGIEKKQKKKKDKQQTTSIIHIPDEDGDEVLPLINNMERGPAPNLFVGATPVTANSPKSTPTPPPTQIPKLTLKLSGKSTPLPHTNDMTDNDTPPTIQRERDHSPELARFSPLVTGPPKTKQSDSAHLLSITSTATSISPLLGNCSGNLSGNSSVNTTTLQMPSLVSASINPRTIHQPIASSSSGWMSISNNNTNTSATSTLSASSVLLPQQLMLMTPKPNLNNFPSINVAGTAGRPTLPNNLPESSSQIVETKNHHRPSSYVDAEGNRIWICPACGKVDDGSAMIGCDGCDAWYHWICVGITIAPKDNDDWFCRVCITKKKVFGSDKKAKKRNKKK